MGGIVAVLYGAAAYMLFVGAFLYAIVFTGNLGGAKTIDSGEVGTLLPSLAVNVALLGAFAVQHSVMARPGFKRVWTKVVPHSVERATFVVFTSAALGLLYWQWRPLPDVLWQVTSEPGLTVVWAVFWLGWAVVLYSTFLIHHFELFGLRQVWARLTGTPIPAPEFRTPGLYKRVRHPIYLGFLLAFWATPEMTVGHLLFALATTGYILIGIQLEERDLIRLFGEKYRQYRAEVAMLIPWPGRRARPQAAEADWPPLALRGPKPEV
ncbi:methanethiol S-methyltransferase [Desertibaculum subflavum]|uniref:methanethiol S-methyltransferase n=1 Tax=Desertibaculum subflavum TaxID=2268458 RepID=UPI000E661841